jgi:pimeloyl-ACP methyl ester carboxylesterase
MAEWLAGERAVDAAIAVGAPSDLVTWRAIQPGGRLAWLPRAIRLGDDAWRWSPARIFDRRRGTAQPDAPLMVVQARRDEYVEAGQARMMQARGARLVVVPGLHCINLRWRASALAFAAHATAAG